MARASDCRGGSAGGGGQEASQGFPEGNRELDLESAGLLGLHVEDGQAGEAGGWMVTGKRRRDPDRKSSSRGRKLMT